MKLEPFNPKSLTPDQIISIVGSTLYFRFDHQEDDELHFVNTHTGKHFVFDAKVSNELEILMLSLADLFRHIGQVEGRNEIRERYNQLMESEKTA